ncbi:MAG: hypothetical protein IJW87_02560 [Clostridia bacterium]|nr:hypothetical protein [Clostridia bacterium]
MKRFLALALSVAMILSVCLFAGCGDTAEETTTASSSTPAQTTTEGNKPADETTTKNDQPEDTTKADDPDDTTTVGGGDDPVETTTADTTTEDEGGDDPIPGGALNYDELDGYSKLPGYEDVDFGGRTFVIGVFEGSDELGGGRWDNFREVYSEETDAISTAARERNAIMEKLYNCTIEGNRSSSPASIAGADVTGNQHTLDLYCTSGVGTGTFMNDSAYNLLNYGIDFSHPWWDQQFVDTFSIRKSSGEKVLYAAVGDFAFNAFSAVHLMFYNKTLKDATIPDIDLYQLVRDKKWTVDVFMDILKRPEIAKDSNGNSDYDYVNDGDIVAWVRTDQSNHGIHAASGLSIVDSVDGVMSFACANHTNEWVAVIDKGIQLANVETADYISYSYVQKAIEEGKALFASEVLDVLERMKDADVSVGLMPYPLYSETQENYAHFVTTRFPAYVMPISVPDPEVVGEFFELYAYHSKYIVRTAYIDTYCVEYCGDQESAEMLEIILDSRTYDPGYVFWSAYETDIGNMIVNGKNTMTQWIGRKGATLNNNIADFVTGISDNTN